MLVLRKRIEMKEKIPKSSISPFACFSPRLASLRVVDVNTEGAKVTRTSSLIGLSTFYSGGIREKYIKKGTKIKRKI